MSVKRLSAKHKNNKLLYYSKNYARQVVPTRYYQAKLSARLKSIHTLSADEHEKLLFRVNYYNKLEEPVELGTTARKLADLNLKNSLKTYYFDLFEYSRFFNQELKGHFLFGDVSILPEEPTVVKSRPILEDNANSILLKLNKVRHFTFVKGDNTAFSQKKNMLVGRNAVSPRQEHRVQFLKQYFGHPMCNIGKVNDNELNPLWTVNRMTINEQLQYKFILSLEGNDVASNLKWIMSSNSLAVMPKPKFETWFMEGLLIPDHHYVLINDDYSDLEAKLTYYINNPKKAETIRKNANNFVGQFKNKKLEDLISLSVLKKYFEKTNQ